MADQIDQQITYSVTTQEATLSKYNRGPEHGFFRITTPADAHYAIVGVKTAVLLNPSQRQTLETTIEAMLGVQSAKVLMYGDTPPASDVPASGYHIEAVGGIRFRIEPDVV